METYTQETLDSIINYRDLQDVAKECGANARGSREELISRILEAQAALPSPSEVGSPDIEQVPADEPSADAPPTTLAQGDVAEGGPSLPPTSDTLEPEPARKETPAAPRKPVSAAAKRYAGQLVAGYLSSEGFTPEMEQELVAALEAGHQPCVVKGSGNTKFEFRVYPQPFNRAIIADDVPAKRDGVVMNVSRRLADANLLPFT